MKPIHYLELPLWELYQAGSVEKIRFNNTSATRLKERRDLEFRQDLYKALIWAENNPTYNFKEIVNGIPIPRKLNLSNTELLNYLMHFKAFMENKHFNLK